ncbi:MAG TPA: cation:proton antiporter [Gaiellaceae bacterium]|jgi:NhaP-type Na+/H+ or K+/H+ antiporter|nr:cation:proton antiporter [Gaiellaceae bacterium]
MSSWALAVIAAIVIAYTALSRWLDTTPVTGPIFFLTAGIALGSKGLGWVTLTPQSEQIRLLAEVTLTLVLFADASRIDLAALRREYAVPARLLGIGLPLTILAGWAVADGLFDSFGAAELVLLAVILAPTDAALGQAVVTDERLPSRIRQGLNVESGLNDGICVPLLLIALAAAEAENGSSTTHAALRLLVEAIGYGTLFGAVAGAVGAFAILVGHGRGLMGPGGRQILAGATAALAYGLAAPPGGSGFIAAFVAGCVFGAILHHDENRGEAVATRLVDELGEATSAGVFIVFGAAIVGPVFAGLTWREVAYGILSLTVVRMLPVWISLLGTGARGPTIAFVGWFGPRGLASIVFTVIVLEDGNLPHATTLTATVVFTIVLSIYAHGVSAQPLTSRYAAWYRSHPGDRRPQMESVPVTPHRWRRQLRRSEPVDVAAG